MITQNNVNNVGTNNNTNILDIIQNKFNELATYLNMDKFILIIIIIILFGIIICSIIGYIIFKKNKYEQQELKRLMDEKLEKETGIKNLIKDPKIVVVNNKIEKKTKNEKKIFNSDKDKFKHTIFIKNIDNSIQFCIENNKFDIAEQIEKFKTIYIKLHKLYNSENSDTKKIKKYTIELNIIDTSIRKRLEMD